METYENMPEMMTATEMAKLTGEHAGSIRRGIAAGRIPANKVNGKWLIAKDAAFPNLTRAAREAKAAAAAGRCDVRG